MAPGHTEAGVAAPALMLGQGTNVLRIVAKEGTRLDRGPLIVQSDLTLLLEVDHPAFAEARDALVGFAELIKSPEHVHTYRLSALSLWNAQAAGLTAEAVLAALDRFSAYPVPEEVRRYVLDQARRYGRLVLTTAPDGDGLWLGADDPPLLTLIGRLKSVAPYLAAALPGGYRVRPEHRGLLKQALVKEGWPCHDLAGYHAGEALPLELRARTPSGEAWRLRDYQVQAVRAFWGDGGVERGNGVVVLPCGAGKTLVGIGVMAEAKTHTLILATSVAALHQWRDELLQRTTLQPDDIGEYSAAVKQPRPVTLTTYQILSHRRGGEYIHFRRLDEGRWGLIIYDEVHLVPAPVFRLTASLQARRRLGLTATLIREDGRADDVFSLIGPKRFDMPWRLLEEQGWIAGAQCREIRVAMPPALRERYALAEDAERVRVAAENPVKLPVVLQLLDQHRGDHILIIGQYLDQLKQIAQAVGAPLITGETPPREREQLYAGFREGRTPILVVSKVANFSIDLPDANVAIQVSGAFGSRQEEAQRLGRILRPKRNGGVATFYSLVSEDSREQDFAQKRQLFLCEQGYRYLVAHTDEAGRPRQPQLAKVTPLRAVERQGGSP